MDSQIASYITDSGQTVLFEISPLAGYTPASGDDLVAHVRDALGPAMAAAQTVVDGVRRVRPDHVEVKFGVKVTGTVNWIIAKAATEGNFEITLSWNGNDPAGRSEPPSATTSP